jgi:hypothetical protein
VRPAAPLQPAVDALFDASEDTDDFTFDIDVTNDCRVLYTGAPSDASGSGTVATAPEAMWGLVLHADSQALEAEAVRPHVVLRCGHGIHLQTCLLQHALVRKYIDVLQLAASQSLQLASAWQLAR